MGKPPVERWFPQWISAGTKPCGTAPSARWRFVWWTAARSTRPAAWVLLGLGRDLRAVFRRSGARWEASVSAQKTMGMTWNTTEFSNDLWRDGIILWENSYGVSWNRGAPSSHPSMDGIFRYKPSSELGVAPWRAGNLHICELMG